MDSNAVLMSRSCATSACCPRLSVNGKIKPLILAGTFFNLECCAQVRTPPQPTLTAADAALGGAAQLEVLAPPADRSCMGVPSVAQGRCPQAS